MPLAAAATAAQIEIFCEILEKIPELGFLFFSLLQWELATASEAVGSSFQLSVHLFTCPLFEAFQADDIVVTWSQLTMYFDYIRNQFWLKAPRRKSE